MKAHTPPIVDLATVRVANVPVDELDLERYAGNWHEIAHLPMRYERKCLDSVTATYTPRPDGTLEVRNACRTRRGLFEESIGVARTTDTPGALKVRFAPRWLSWLPFVWADYWVIGIDRSYQWALVGGPSRKYLWLLSRTSAMKPALFRKLTGSAAAMGYRIERLIMTAQIQ